MAPPGGCTFSECRTDGMDGTTALHVGARGSGEAAGNSAFHLYDMQTQRGIFTRPPYRRRTHRAIGFARSKRRTGKNRRETHNSAQFAVSSPRVRNTPPPHCPTVTRNVSAIGIARSRKAEPGKKIAAKCTILHNSPFIRPSCEPAWNPAARGPAPLLTDALQQGRNTTRHFTRALHRCRNIGNWLRSFKKVNRKKSPRNAQSCTIRRVFATRPTSPLEPAPSLHRPPRPPRGARFSVPAGALVCRRGHASPRRLSRSPLDRQRRRRLSRPRKIVA
jgi:hypothetical protein